MAEDFDAILARADTERWARLGEDVVYQAPDDVVGTTVRAIWHSEVEEGSSLRGTETRVTRHMASFRAAEVTPVRRATITRKGRTFSVMTVHPGSDRQSWMVTLSDDGAVS